MTAEKADASYVVIEQEPKVEPSQLAPFNEDAVEYGRAIPITKHTQAHLGKLLAEAGIAVSIDDDDEEDWQERALCSQADPEAFFPEKSQSNKDAKALCQSCGVRTECLEYALENGEKFGVWGGLSERERRELLKTA